MTDNDSVSYLAIGDTRATSDGSSVTTTVVPVQRDHERDESILTVADVRRQNAEEARLGVELDRSDSVEPGA